MGDDERRGRRGGDGGEPLARQGEAVEALVRRVLAEQRRDPVAPVESLQASSTGLDILDRPRHQAVISRVVP